MSTLDEPTRRPCAHLSRLLDGIDDNTNLAFLIAKWEGRSKATITDVHKAGNFIVRVSSRTSQPLANQAYSGGGTPTAVRPSRVSNQGGCQLHPYAGHLWSHSDKNPNTIDKQEQARLEMEHASRRVFYFATYLNFVIYSYARFQ